MELSDDSEGNSIRIRVGQVKLAQKATVDIYTELENGQGEHPTLLIIKSFLNNGKEPDKGELFLASPEAKNYIKS